MALMVFSFSTDISEGSQRETRQEGKKVQQMCGGSTPGELNTGAVGVLHTTVSASKVL